MSRFFYQLVHDAVQGLNHHLLKRGKGPGFLRVNNAAYDIIAKLYLGVIGRCLRQDFPALQINELAPEGSGPDIHYNGVVPSGCVPRLHAYQLGTACAPQLVLPQLGFHPRLHHGDGHFPCRVSQGAGEPLQQEKIYGDVFQSVLPFERAQQPREIADVVAQGGRLKFHKKFFQGGIIPGPIHQLFNFLGNCLPAVGNPDAGSLHGGLLQRLFFRHGDLDVAHQP
ncbi:MAG: hypothetical protein H6Q45_793 [Deltaproteobacteria bacterium]|nr:hypothetical protein [Deltaproteobacteria bacterium]